MAESDLGVPVPAIQAASYLKSTSLLDLDFAWRGIAGQPFDLTAFATNVTNKHYYTYTSGIGSDGVEYQGIGAPAMFGVRVRYHFGAH